MSFYFTVPLDDKPRAAARVPLALVRAPVVAGRAVAHSVCGGRALELLALVVVTGGAAGQAAVQVVPVLSVIAFWTRRALRGHTARAWRGHTRARWAELAPKRVAALWVLVVDRGWRVRGCSSGDRRHHQQ